MARRAVRRTESLLAGLLLAGLLLAACVERHPPAIGLVLGDSFLDAARLAFEDLDRDSAGLGVDTVLLFERSSDAGPALELAEQVVSTPGVVAVVGHSNSAASLAAAPVYGDARIVQIAPTSTSVLYSQAGPFSFRLVPPDDAQAQFLVRAIRTRYPRGARIAVLYVNDDYGRGLHDAVGAGIDSAPWRVVFDLPHVDREERPANMAQAIRAVSRARPDLVLWLGRAATLHAYLPGLRDALPTVDIIGGDALSTWVTFKARDGRWAGVQYVEFVDLASTPGLRAFGERYRARFGRTASGADVLTYDAVMLLMTAVRGGASDGESVRRYLDALGRATPAYEGLSGPIAFSESGDVARDPVLLRVPASALP